jgi:hypothetical protein
MLVHRDKAVVLPGRPSTNTFKRYVADGLRLIFNDYVLSIVRVQDESPSVDEKGLPTIALKDTLIEFL